MIDLQLLRTEEGFQRVLASLAKRGDATGANDLRTAAEKRRAVIRETESLSQERNTQSKKLGELKAQGKQAEFDALRETMKGMESVLDAGQFIRIHRSTIVNADRIRELQPLFHGEYAVILRDGTRLVASRGPDNRLKKLLAEATIHG